MNSLIPLGNIFNNNINNNISNNIYNKEEKLINEYEKYINDIGKLLGVEFKKEIKEKQIKDYFLYCKDIAKCLETIEKDVNKYISQIEVLISNDKNIIMKSIRNIRRENKVKKKLNAEKQRLENNKLKYIKSIERKQKSVIKRHKIIIDAPLINNNKNKKNRINKKYNDELDYFLFSSEE